MQKPRAGHFFLARRLDPRKAFPGRLHFLPIGPNPIESTQLIALPRDRASDTGPSTASG
jgi:hypothetical protein